MSKEAEHPVTLMNSTIINAEILGVIETKTVYNKRINSTWDTGLINKHLPDAIEAANSKSDVTIDANKVKLFVNEKYHSEVFKMPREHNYHLSGRLGKVNITQHRMDLILGARSFKCAPNRDGPRTRELEQFKIYKQLKPGFIEQSVSEWNSPVLFAPKSDQSLRFCVGYGKLSTMTDKDSYHMPLMDEFIDSIVESNVCTTSDSYSDYWQVFIAPEVRHKTSFICQAGTYQYIRIPYG